MRVLRLILRCLVAAGIMAAPLCAAPILYIEAGEVSGTLGLTTLANTPFEFDFEANTADLAGVGLTFDPYSNPVRLGFVSVGAWKGSFTTPLTMDLVSSPRAIGFFDMSGNDGIDFAATGLSNYHLARAISISSPNSQYAAGWLSTDTGGTLTFTGAKDLTFTTIASVPEAGGLAYAAIGLVMIVLCIRPLRRESFRMGGRAGSR